MMKILFLIFLGGGLGSLCRYLIGKLVLSLSGSTLLPLGTVGANVLACLVFAFVVLKWGSQLDMENSIKAFFLIGFCGGFSTFSAFSFESFQLIKSGHTMAALANILISIVLCTAVFFLLLRKMDV